MKVIYALLFISLFTSCIGGGVRKVEDKQRVEITNTAEQSETELTLPKSKMAVKLDSMGLIDITTLIPDITVHLIYATVDNFTNEVLYDDLWEAYFLPEVAQKIVVAHYLLKEKHPKYGFIVYDAARPMSVQQKMRDVAVSMGKGYYVSNPANGGGLHNYGAAVDLTISDENGTPLPMGSDFDYFGVEANTDNEEELVRSGKISQEELNNRLLLRKIMTQAGFKTIKSEWWHFNHCLRAEAIEKYELIDF